jgi:hypothetical protein
LSIDTSDAIEFKEEDDLYKRLPPTLCDCDGNPTAGIWRLKKKPDPEPSVDLARLTTPEAVLAGARGRPGFGVGKITVKDANELGFSVRYQPELGNNAHCILVGENTIEKTRDLATRTKVVIPPIPIKPGT